MLHMAIGQLTKLLNLSQINKRTEQSALKPPCLQSKKPKTQQTETEVIKNGKKSKQNKNFI